MASLESSWSHGYVTELDYTRGFYADMAPEWLAFVASTLGFDPPAIDGAFRYLELGCGRGFTTNVLAAAHPRAELVANDMNPSHVQSARRLARDAGLSNVTFLESSFEELLSQDIGKFDFIALHGILSWVSAETQAQIVRILSERLDAGGLVYVSYNCLPGRAAQEPLRRLFLEDAARRVGPLEQRVADAQRFARALRDGGAGYFTQTPTAAARLDEVGTQRQDYVAHEFFNRDWRPLYHLDVRSAFAAAKLVYVGTTMLVENTDALIPAEVRAPFLEIQDAAWKEQVRDYITNRQFRVDLYMRGGCRLSAPRQREHLEALRLCLVADVSGFEYKLRVPPVEVALARDIYEALFEALARGPLTMREIVEATNGKVSEQHVREACFLTAGLLRPATTATGPTAAACARFNQAAVREALAGDEVPALASPVLGSGVRIATPDILALAAMEQGGGDEAVLDRAMAHLTRADRLEANEPGAAEGARARLRERIAALEAQMVPVWKRLGVSTLA